jgi:hypothetical protein
VLELAFALEPELPSVVDVTDVLVSGSSLPTRPTSFVDVLDELFVVVPTPFVEGPTEFVAGPTVLVVSGSSFPTRPTSFVGPVVGPVVGPTLFVVPTSFVGPKLFVGT